MLGDGGQGFWTFSCVYPMYYEDWKRFFGKYLVIPITVQPVHFSSMLAEIKSSKCLPSTYIIQKSCEGAEMPKYL